MTTATHNGKTYRAIYLHTGHPRGMWATDVLLNPPMPPNTRLRKLVKRNRKTKKQNPEEVNDREVNDREVIEIAKMVYRTSIKYTANYYGVTVSAILSRIRRFERRLGYRIFPKGGYSILTYHGKKFMLAHGMDEKEINKG